MESLRFRPKKRFGQHFLTNEAVVEIIVKAAELTGEDIVVEIGPGLGVLTKSLAAQAGTVVAIELDSSLAATLSQSLCRCENVRLITADFLKMDVTALLRDQLPEWAGVFKVVANIPYYITAPIIVKLMELKGIEVIVLMVQEEVAQRLAARPGGKEYGALSVLVQYHSRVEVIEKVPGEWFYPVPKVDSAVVRLTPRPPEIAVGDKEFFFRVVRSSFAQRRKTIANALAAGFGLPRDEIGRVLAEAGLDPVRRGETFSLPEFAVVAEKLSERLDIRETDA